jgi:hypothetical protein
MTFDEFLPVLEEELDALSPLHRLAFSAACCERATPNLEAYAGQTGVVDAAAVRQALNETWDFASGTRPNLDVEALRQGCREQLPPPLDNHLLASAAADAIQMVDLLLQQAADPRASLSREIAGWAEASVDGYLQTGPPSIADLPRLPLAPLMQRELRRQVADLDWLKGERTLRPGSLASLRLRAAAEGGSLA